MDPGQKYCDLNKRLLIEAFAGTVLIIKKFENLLFIKGFDHSFEFVLHVAVPGFGDGAGVEILHRLHEIRYSAGADEIKFFEVKNDFLGHAVGLRVAHELIQIVAKGDGGFETELAVHRYHDRVANFFNLSFHFEALWEIRYRFAANGFSKLFFTG